MPAEHIKYTAQIPKYEGANSLGNRSNNRE